MSRKRCKSVDQYIEAAEYWQEELRVLRRILRVTDLEETTKWGAPCYTFGGRNVVGLGAFKSYFGLWFFQGALLKDKGRALINAQSGRTKAQRQWRFNSKADIEPRDVTAYVNEAITHAAAGREIKADRNKPVLVPPDLSAALVKDKKAKAAFAVMGRGIQREYAQYIADAKRDATKARRLEKILPMITAGQGLNDKYR
ncbi:MAG: YdeI/OmpD-associated family protein [Gammaproteobacteria bacterium]|nr:YdeI/OmpD-associated family protein [Gammaproteobacteria bacterium]